MMIQLIYVLMLITSLLCSGVFFWRWHRHMDFSFTLFYIFTPITMLGYVLMAYSWDLGSMVTGLKVQYMGAIFMQLTVIMIIFSLCKIRLPRWLNFVMILISTMITASVMTIGVSPLFYKNQTLYRKNGIIHLQKVYGPMHTVFLFWLLMLLFVSLFVLIYARLKIPEASIFNTILLFIAEFVTILAYLFGKRIRINFEMASPAIVLSCIIFLIIADRICLYNVDDTVMDTLIGQGNTGYLTFDFNHNYLGSTRMAKKLIPQLKVAQVDKPLVNQELHDRVEEWLADFNKDEVSRDIYYKNNGKIYLIKVGFLLDGGRKRGYQIDILDDTRHREYLASIEAYNKNLNEELEKKTKMLEEMK